MVVSKNEHIAAMREVNAAFKAQDKAITELLAVVDELKAELEKVKPAPKKAAAKK